MPSSRLKKTSFWDEYSTVRHLDVQLLSQWGSYLQFAEAFCFKESFKREKKLVIFLAIPKLNVSLVELRYPFQLKFVESAF